MLEFALTSPLKPIEWEDKMEDLGSVPDPENEEDELGGVITH